VPLQVNRHLAQQETIEEALILIRCVPPVELCDNIALSLGQQRNDDPELIILEPEAIAIGFGVI